MSVIKRDGSSEPLSLDKIRKSLSWAADGLNVNPLDVESNSRLHIYDGIQTDFIHDVMVKTAYDMSTEQYPDYDRMAARLLMQKQYKYVFQSTKPIHLSEYLDKFSKYYAVCITKLGDNSYFDEDDLDYLNSQIDYTRDLDFSYIGLKTFMTSYFIHDKEIPQLIFMLIAMDAYRDRSLSDIAQLYHDLSTFKISLPSPEMRALRTNSNHYSSCCTIRSGDSIDSWCEADSAVIKHTVDSNGIGLDIADIASIGDKVKNNTINHGGKVPIAHSFERLIGKSVQNKRRGSGTANINFFDPEIISLLGLRSYRTAADKRTTSLSYTIKVNQLIYDRAKSGGDITLFSTRDSSQLLLMFYSKDYPKFLYFYENLESKFPNNERISARYLLEQILTISQETSAYYLLNIDEVNERSTYDNPISQGNICNEFVTPTLPLDSSKPNEPAIGICTLAGINQANVGLEDLERICMQAVRLQNTVSSRQLHPTPQANAFVHHYADIGVGITNHAYWLAKQNLKYGTSEALSLFNEWMESFQYYLISASMNLAKSGEFNVPNGFESTYFSRGLMPTDFNNRQTKLDWTFLREQVLEYGMVNCGLSMQFPAETSSIIGGGTSGAEPIRNLITVKDSKDGFIKQFAPESATIGHQYTFAFEEPDMNTKLINHYAVMQDWMDKAISANLYYNPEHTNGKVLMSKLIEDVYLAKKLKLKGFYYRNTKTASATDTTTQACVGGGCNL